VIGSNPDSPNPGVGIEIAFDQLPSLPSFPSIPMPSLPSFEESAHGLSSRLYTEGNTTVDFTIGSDAGSGQPGVGIEIAFDQLPSLPSFPSISMPSLPSFKESAHGLSSRLYTEGNTTVDLVLGSNPDSPNPGSGIEIAFDQLPALLTTFSLSYLWERLQAEGVSFEAAIQPGPSPSEPLLTFGLQIGDRETPLPTFDWTGYPEFYLDARTLDLHGAFI